MIFNIKIYILYAVLGAPVDIHHARNGENSNLALAPLAYTPAPLSDLTPTGWMRNQLELQGECNQFQGLPPPSPRYHSQSYIWPHPTLFFFFMVFFIWVTLN